jgi:hypothetical protein
MAFPNHRLRALVLALVGALCSACFDPIPAFTLAPPLQPPPGSISGTIKDACTGKPIVNANVIATEILSGVQQGGGYGRAVHVQSDANGYFLLEDVPTGRVQVWVHGGYKYISKLFELELGDGQARSGLAVPLYVRDAVPPIAKLDLLFVIDDSSSMSEEQTALADAFEAFVLALRGALRSSNPDLGTVNLDLRIGVVSTDLGAGDRRDVPTCLSPKGGALLTEARIPGCPRPLDPWIGLLADGTTNVPGGSADPLRRAAESFACISQLGTLGCGFEQPLEAARRALDPDGPGSSFLRADAALALVLISDEDDCSAVAPEALFDPDPKLLGPLTSFRCAEFGLSCINDRQPGVRTGCVPDKDWLHKVEDYVAFFKAARPGKLFFAALAGPPGPVVVGLEKGDPMLQPSCYSALGSAVPALRLKAVADGLPASFFASICDGFVPSFQTIASRIVDTSIGLVCPSP